mmetsp:Transcript_735/g.785  ORF Transcript_735/g.785 Transcript_735/m.785 type:complete len:323 (+) Transcript_735:976-1944(+)
MESAEEDLLIMEVDDEKLSEKVMNKLITEKKVKQNLSDELDQLAQNLESVIQQLDFKGYTKVKSASEFLQKHCSILHLKLLGGLCGTLETFYEKKMTAKGVSKLLEALREITHIDLRAPIFKNAFVIHFKTFCPEHRSIFGADLVKTDNKTFKRMVKPLKNEEEKCPEEFLLLEQIFANLVLKDNSSNYPGQILSQRFSCLNSIHLGLNREEINLMQQGFISLEGTVQEILEHLKMNRAGSDAVLQKTEQLYNEQLTYKLMQFAIIILVNSSTLPEDPNEFNRIFFTKYKEEVYWKIELEKERKALKNQTMKNQDSKAKVQS